MISNPKLIFYVFSEKMIQLVDPIEQKLIDKLHENGFDVFGESFDPDIKKPSLIVKHENTVYHVVKDFIMLYRIECTQFYGIPQTIYHPK
jgi:hypothetical protein